jgi:hypothetical protein
VKLENFTIVGLIFKLGIIHNFTETVCKYKRMSGVNIVSPFLVAFVPIIFRHEGTASLVYGKVVAELIVV